MDTRGINTPKQHSIQNEPLGKIEMKDLKFDNRTMCEILSLDYDFETHSGNLYMGPSSATDMGGCIEIFTGIDPKVQEIKTWRTMNTEKVKDTFYVKKNSDWHAVLPQP